MPYEDYLNQIPGIRRTKSALKGAYDWAGRKAENFVENVYHPIFRQAGGIVRTGFEEAERNKQGIPYDVAEHRARLTTNLAKANIKQEAERNAWQEPLRTQPLPFTPEEPFNRSSGLPETTRNNVLRNQPVASQVGAASHLVPPRDKTSTQTTPRVIFPPTGGLAQQEETGGAPQYPPGAPMVGIRPDTEEIVPPSTVGRGGEPTENTIPLPPPPSPGQPPEKGWLQRAGEAIGNISQPALMGLATTGLSMMAKGGQYTEKPQTLGGIAGEAGLAGLGTYLTLKEREEARATKEKALAATQAYQAAKLGQGQENLALQARSKDLAEKTQAWREKEAMFETREVPVGPGKTVKMRVLKSDVTPTPQTMDKFKMELLQNNPELQKDFLYSLTGHKELTVKNMKTSGEGWIDVYSPSGEHIGRYNYLDEKVQTALGRVGEKRALDARKEIESGHRTEEGAIWKDLAAKAKVQTKDIVGKPADEVLRILMSGGVDKKEVDEALKKAETVRTKWNKFRADWSRTYGPMMGAVVPPSAYEQPPAAENLPPISSGAENIWNRKPQP